MSRAGGLSGDVLRLRGDELRAGVVVVILCVLGRVGVCGSAGVGLGLVGDDGLGLVGDDGRAVVVDSFCFLLGLPGSSTSMTVASTSMSVLLASSSEKGEGRFEGVFGGAMRSAIVNPCFLGLRLGVCVLGPPAVCGVGRPGVGAAWRREGVDGSAGSGSVRALDRVFSDLDGELCDLDGEVGREVASWEGVYFFDCEVLLSELTSANSSFSASTSRCMDDSVSMTWLTSERATWYLFTTEVMPTPRFSTYRRLMRKPRTVPVEKQNITVP